MPEKKALNTALSIFVFLLVFVISFLPSNLTMAPGAGPGSASGWLVSAIGQGVGDNAKFSPLFVIITQIVGNISDIKEIPVVLNYLTYTGYALFSSIISIILLHLFRRWNFWGSVVLAIVGGLTVASSRLFWASGLLVNPATWALTLAALAALLAIKPVEQEKLSSVRIISSMFFLLLAMLTHLGAILLVPMVFILIHSNGFKNLKLSIIMGVIISVIPIAIYFIFNAENVFMVRGILNAAPGISFNRGFRLIGWSILWSVTPVGLLLALWGVYAAISRENMTAAYIVSSIADVAIIGGLVGSELAEFAAIFISAAIAGLMIIGLVDLLNRVKEPLVLVTVLVIPVLFIFNGSKIARGSEDIWKIHNENTFRTIRLNSIVLSTDEVILNTLYSYYRVAETMRGDLTVINPKRFHESAYLNYLEKNYYDRFKACSETFNNLKNAVDKSEGIAEAEDAFILDLIDKYNNKPGILVTNGYKLPEGDYNLVAEGLFMRIHCDGPDHVYHFSGLKLDKIKFEENMPPAQQYVVSQYVAYFTMRGSYLLRKEYTPEGFDYVRWALKINPNYVPAKLLARQYDIKGEPRYLGH